MESCGMLWVYTWMGSHLCLDSYLRMGLHLCMDLPHGFTRMPGFTPTHGFTPMRGFTPQWIYIYERQRIGLHLFRVPHPCVCKAMHGSPLMEAVPTTTSNDHYLQQLSSLYSATTFNNYHQLQRPTNTFKYNFRFTIPNTLSTPAIQQLLLERHHTPTR